LALVLKHAFNFRPTTGSYDTTQTVKFGSPTFGPLRLFTTLDFFLNSDNAKLLKASLNAQIKNDYHVGLKLDHNLDEVKTLLAQAVYKSNKGDFSLRSNILDKSVTLGCTHSHSSRYRHSYKLLIDTKGEKELVYGYPVAFYFGSTYNVNDNITFKGKIDYE